MLCSKCKSRPIITVETGLSRARLLYKHFLTCFLRYLFCESMGGACLSRSHILQDGPSLPLTVTTKQIRKKGAFTGLSGAN